MNSTSEDTVEEQAGGSLRWRLILIALFIVLITAFYASGMYRYVSWDSLKARRDSWKGFVDDHFLVSAIGFVIVSIILMALSLPVGSILSLTAGALFGLWWGVFLITIASSIGSTLAFLASRYLFRDLVRRWFRRWLGIVDRGIEKDGAGYLLMLRLSPVVPFFALNATMGLTKMSTGTYAGVTLVGMLPSCFLYVMAGTQLMRLESPKDILSVELIIILTLLGVSPLLMKWVFRKRTASGRPSEPPSP